MKPERPDDFRDRSRTRVLVVDDEPPARRRLRRLLEHRADVEWVGEATNGRTAVETIGAHAIDLVFLDIQMPDLDGFGVLAEIGVEHMPGVVFVTAFDHYAIEAFDFNALDYLLKPFTDERFETAFLRARERLRQKQSDEVCERLACLLEARNPDALYPRQRNQSEADPADDSPATLRRFAVHHGERIFFVPVAEIDWIEAEGAYVRLHRGKQTHLVRDSLKNLEKRLDRTRFLRVHRSTMVQLDRIVEMAPLFHGEYELVLRDGTKLKLSRSFRDRLPQIRGG